MNVEPSWAKRQLNALATIYMLQRMENNTLRQDWQPTVVILTGPITHNNIFSRNSNFTQQTAIKHQEQRGHA